MKTLFRLLVLFLLTGCTGSTLPVYLDPHDAEIRDAVFYVQEAAAVWGYEVDLRIAGQGAVKVKFENDLLERKGVMGQTDPRRLCRPRVRVQLQEEEEQTINTLAHEIGHALTVGHYETAGNLMFAYAAIDAWDLTDRQLDRAERGRERLCTCIPCD